MLAGLLLPLGLDTFAVAAALGMLGIEPRGRQRITVIFTVFETAMPLLGSFAGSLAGNAIGGAADYIAIAVLVGLGLYMLLPTREAGEKSRVRLLGRTRGLAAIGLGISISMDELAIGFSIGLLRFPLLLVLVLIGSQTFVVTQVGLRLGAAIGEAIRETAERLAAIALVALGAILLAERLLTGR